MSRLKFTMQLFDEMALLSTNGEQVIELFEQPVDARQLCSDGLCFRR